MELLFIIPFMIYVLTWAAFLVAASVSAEFPAELGSWNMHSQDCIKTEKHWWARVGKGNVKILDATFI